MPARTPLIPPTRTGLRQGSVSLFMTQNSSGRAASKPAAHHQEAIDPSGGN